MERRTETLESTRRAIVNMKEAGMKDATVARISKIPERTVSSILSRFRERGTVANEPRNAEACETFGVAEPITGPEPQHIWEELERRCAKQPCTNKDQKFAQLVKEWNAISTEAIRTSSNHY
ncbi:hypothetical protein TELCIR_18538, partial [Teladorsagia circumcincta]